MTEKPVKKATPAKATESTTSEYINPKDGSYAQERMEKSKPEDK